MALTTTGTINCSVVGTQTQTTTNRTTTKSDTFSFTKTFTSGSGNQQLNAVWDTSGILSAGGQYVLDLNNLTKNVFGSTIALNFSGGKVRCIAIQNKSNLTNAEFRIVATGVSPFNNPFHGNSGNIPVKPGSAYIFSDTIFGTSIGTGNRYLRLSDQGSGVPYEILVVGVTG